MEFQFQVLLNLPVLLQQLHAAIAGDAVAEMHDEIAFVQVEKAVNCTAEVPSCHCRPLHVGAAEKLAATEHDDPLGHQPEAALQRADGEVQAAVAGDLRRAEDLAQAADFGLGLTYQEHFLSAAGVVQLVADFVDLPAEPLDRFDRQAASRFQRADSDRRGRDRGKCCRLAYHVSHRMKALRVRKAFKILPAFGLQIARLDQQKPAFRREVVGKMPQ